MKSAHKWRFKSSGHEFHADWAGHECSKNSCAEQLVTSATSAGYSRQELAEACAARNERCVTRVMPAPPPGSSASDRFDERIGGQLEKQAGGGPRLSRPNAAL